METVKNSSHDFNIFGDINNYDLIDLLCLKVIINELYNSRKAISINEISSKLLSNYWGIKFNSNNRQFVIQDLNEMKNALMSKYGLSEDSSEQDIEQIINYYQDKSLKLKLFAIAKSTLQNLSKILKNITNNGETKANLKKLGLHNKEFIVIKSNKSIIINKNWYDLIIKDKCCKNIIDEMVDNKLNYSNSNNTVNTSDSTQIKKMNKEEDFNKLHKLEKRLKFNMDLNKNKYYCLESALNWLKMDLGLYEELHNKYIEFIEQYSVKNATTKLPILSSVILIFTAVYRYNEEDASGFWPEFFDDPNYNYAQDVPIIMDCLNNMINSYGINASKRQYMNKKNMSLIFSQIYIPDISLRKVYSAIYIYYFRNNKSTKTINRQDFIDNNEYRLDKPGVFFLTEDVQFKDSFNDLVELVKNTLNNTEINELFDFPDRFYKALNYWKNNEKNELDKESMEFYISNPNISIDCVNNEIFIHLPKQKSRLYSDEDLGWNLTIDNSKETVYGRIIRKRNGDYLILEDKFRLQSEFKKIKVEYIFNNKSQRYWDFEIKNEYIIFDKNGNLQKNDTLTRDGCYLGVPNNIKIDNDFAIERYVFDGWDNYIFYYLNLSEYPNEQFYLDINKVIAIEDKPVIERNNYKLLFEDWNVSSLYSSTNIYEDVGEFYITAPFINRDDIKITFFDLESNVDNTDSIEINYSYKNTIKLDFNDNLKSGFYNITLKYKDKTCYTENFVYDRNTKIKSCDVNYNNESSVKTIEVQCNSDIEILSYDLNTKIKKNNKGYLIQTQKTSISKFIYKFSTSEILINKIMRPIKYDLSGLDDVTEGKSSDRILEITKNIMKNHSINLYIRNLDYKHDYLIYSLSILDNITGCDIKITEKLKFGEEINWDFNKLNDRIIDFKDISVALEISDKDDSLITKIPILKIKEYIKFYNFKQYINANQLLITWEEKQINKQRRLNLYNITLPSTNAIEFNLVDGITSLELDMSKAKSGIYVPVLEFKKETSLFEFNESNRRFFNQYEINNDNIIIIDNVLNDSNGQLQLQKCIWLTYSKDYESLNNLTDTLNFSKVDLDIILYSIIQMKYFSNINNGVELNNLLNSTYKILQEILNYIDKDTLINAIIDLSSDFKKDDIGFLINCIIAFGKHNNLSSTTIDNLAEVDLISALCALESGQTKLSSNIILQCRKNFDLELLTSDVIRDYEKIFDIVKNEVRIIGGFWNWLISYKNSYLLSGKYNYSKARIFRIYEDENNIFTFKVLGRTLDDMVDNIINNNIKAHPNLPSHWSSDLNVDKEIYNSLINSVKENKYNQFRDTIIAAFIDVTELSNYSNKKYFNLIMTYHLSNQKDIFNRYRAYFKLIFI